MAVRKTYLKAWRKHLHLTQDQVVARLAEHDDDKLPRTAASLSRIENGHQPYSQRILEALADTYGIEPADLLGRDPTADGLIVDLVARLNPQQRVQAANVLRAFTLDFHGAPDPDEPLVKRN